MSFEGIDGCGKSTQITLLAESLARAGKEAVIVAEPGATELGRKVRKAVVETDGEIHPPAELLCMAAARIQSHHEVVAPALMEGKWVLCDRYLHSSLAYQGYGRDLGAYFVRELCGGLLKAWHEEPVVTLLIDIPVDIMRERTQRRSDGRADRFEADSDRFFEDVRSGYLREAERDARVEVIDGLLPALEIAQKVHSIMTRFEPALQYNTARNRLKER